MEKSSKAAKQQEDSFIKPGFKDYLTAQAQISCSQLYIS
jgi:hypothetical protein